MPEPDPQPLQPRLIHPVRWLLMMVPSMLVIAVPPIAEAWAHHQRSKQTFGDLIGLTLLNSMVAIVLCFVLGFLAERWRWGSIRNVLRVVGFGFLILFMNGIIAFAGCAAILR
jgi:hypothetical protein